MGPRSRERGKFSSHGNKSDTRQASMGPRSRERGKLGGEIALQFVPWLQWGRAHVSAESDIQASRETLPGLASMGPRSRERGKLCTATIWKRLKFELQWGRAHVSAESPASEGVVRPAHGFNGAALT